MLTDNRYLIAVRTQTRRLDAPLILAAKYRKYIRYDIRHLHNDVFLLNFVSSLIF